MSEAIEGVVDNALTKAIGTGVLDTQNQLALLSTFQPFYDDAMKVYEKSQYIIVTDVTQVDLIKQARAARLELRRIRLAAGEKRAEMKEQYLRTGQAIDKVAGVIRTMAEREEQRLDEQEKYIERMETVRKGQLAATRTKELQEVGVADPSFYSLGEMPDAQYANLLTGHREAHIARLESQRRAEGETIRAREEARQKAEVDRLERERLALEAEQLRKDKAEADAKLQQAEAARLAAEKAQADAAAKARQEQERRDAESNRLAAMREKEAKERIEAANRQKEEAERKEREANERAATAERQATEARHKSEQDQLARAARELADAQAAEEERRVKAEADAEVARAAKLRDEQAKEQAKTIATANEFGVSATDKRQAVSFSAKAIPRRMSRNQAILLAAHIVDELDMEYADFAVVLGAVRAAKK